MLPVAWCRKKEIERRAWWAEIALDNCKLLLTENYMVPFSGAFLSMSVFQSAFFNSAFQFRLDQYHLITGPSHPREKRTHLFECQCVQTHGGGGGWKHTLLWKNPKILCNFVSKIMKITKDIANELIPVILHQATKSISSL
jgi:hypothetical protein